MSTHTHKPSDLHVHGIDGRQTNTYNNYNKLEERRSPEKGLKSTATSSVIMKVTSFVTSPHSLMREEGLVKFDTIWNAVAMQPECDPPI